MRALAHVSASTAGIGLRRCLQARSATQPTMRAATTAQPAMSTDGIEAEALPNGLGVVTLNRPEALNAVNREMATAIYERLKAWRDDASVTAVLLQGCFPKAFCAGGDIKRLRQSVLETPYRGAPPVGHEVRSIFEAEYRLVCQVAQYPKPIVSLCEGVWMGFGVGLSIFGRYRICTEATTFAMPECSIGLWPDVGFALAATRCPGATGLYLALTGARLSTPADLLHAGLATHFVPAGAVAGLRQELRNAQLASEAAATLKLTAGPTAAPSGAARQGSQAPASAKTTHRVDSAGGIVEGVIARHSAQADVESSSALAAAQPAIDAAFGPALRYRERGETLAAAVQGVVSRLQGARDASEQGSAERAFAEQTLAALGKQSPTSLAITLSHFAEVAADAAAAWQRGAGSREGQNGTNAVAATGDDAVVRSLIRGVMETEYRIAVRCVALPDFVEGVRAAVVDKDRNPKWAPAALSGIDDGTVQALFVPLPDGVPRW